MLDNFKVLLRQTFRAIHLRKGDSLELNYRDPAVPGITTRLATYTLKDQDAMSITEGVVFEATENGRRVLGGYVVEAKPDHLPTCVAQHDDAEARCDCGVN